MRHAIDAITDGDLEGSWPGKFMIDCVCEAEILINKPLLISEAAAISRAMKRHIRRTGGEGK